MKIENCQICRGPLNSVLWLGYHPPVNDFRSDHNEPMGMYPLELMQCSSCEHVQLGYQVAPKILFPETYPYLSGTTKALRDNFANLAAECEEFRVPGARVLDIGSNDGTLLKAFDGWGVLGIEPSNAAKIARKNGIQTFQTYFGNDLKFDPPCEFNLITACNVFAHIPDPHEVTENVVRLLAHMGVFVSESHYLPSLIETLQYDTIYHEHLRYYHLGALKTLLEAHGLEIFRAKKIPTHGGSIRVFACRKGERAVEDCVGGLLVAENVRLNDFPTDVWWTKHMLCLEMDHIRNCGYRTYGIGAPSRASTLINYTGIDLGCIVEVPGSHKIGKYMPGTKIPVVDESRLYEDQPEYALMLSWHIADDLIPKIKANGYKGKFIIPLPEPRIIG